MKPPWILMYHAVEPYEEDPHLVCVSPETFRRQMEWLDRRGLRGVAVRELLDAGAAARRGLVGVTFDDAYAGIAQYALPVLADLGFSATVFAVADRLGGWNTWDTGPRRTLLSATELAALSRRGIEVGSHGLTHARLTDVSDEHLDEEVGVSRARLAHATGLTIRGFCYPYGACDARAAAAVRRAGYEYACGYRVGQRAGRYVLPRVFVGERDKGFRLLAKRTLRRLEPGTRLSRS